MTIFVLKFFDHALSSAIVSGLHELFPLWAMAMHCQQMQGCFWGFFLSNPNAGINEAQLLGSINLV